MKEDIKKWLEKEINKKEKIYIHFDKKPNLRKEINLNWKIKKEPQYFFEDFFDEKNISKRWFWPLIHFQKEEKRFWKDAKIRDIFYSSYFDWYIYSFYSFLLSKEYEKLILTQNLTNNILAYRSIDWKNNIDFAKDAFEKIISLKNSIVFTFDISKFFDSLDWNILKDQIKKVLNINILPKSWDNIFNSITNYSYIDYKNIIEYKLIKNKVIDKDLFKKAKKNYKKENKGFLVSKNKNNFWISQWTAISWTLANIYMNDFDIYINNFSKKRWWYFFRYSDDILLILPLKNFNEISINEFINIVTKEIIREIKEINLEIQPIKTDIFTFYNSKINSSYSFKEDKNDFIIDKNVKYLQYLGFSFNWENILIRNKSLTKYYRRMKRWIIRLTFLKREIKWKKVLNRDVTAKWKILMWNINKRFTHQKKFKNKKFWNFLNYTLQSYKKMEDLWINNKIKKQVSRNNYHFNKLKRKYKLKK